MIPPSTKVFTMLIRRIASRFCFSCVLVMLILAFGMPLAEASDKSDSSANIPNAASCQSGGCTVELALAQSWNHSETDTNSPHHFPNLLVEITCWGWCAKEKEHLVWLGNHADASMFGSFGDVKTSTAVNPQLTDYIYALLWYTLDDSTPDAYNLGDKWQRDLAHWAAARGLDEEEFYLHTAVPTAKCAAPAKIRPCRLNSRWGRWGTQWYGNLGNPHFVEYTQNRAQRLLVRQGPESIFWDTMDSGGLHEHGCGSQAASLEYGTSCVPYEKNLVQLVVRVREALGGRRLQVNTATYTSAVGAYNGWVAVAAGSVHTEGLNTPFHEYGGAWKYIDEMLEAGVQVAFTYHSYTREEELLSLGRWEHWKTSYSGGNYSSGLRRYQMTTLAQHYLLTPEHLAGNFFWNPNPEDWSVAYGKQWVPAVEVDLGKPIDSRRVLASVGRDGAGQDFDLYRREFSNAYVYARPTKVSTNTAWDDSTAIQVHLPEHNLSLLTPEGLTASIVGDSIWLRNGEGVILIRDHSASLR